MFTFVLDHAQILKCFPDCIEKLDVGHAAKNIYKRVKLLAKDHKALQGFGEKVKRRFQYLSMRQKEMQRCSVEGGILRSCTGVVTTSNAYTQ